MVAELTAQYDRIDYRRHPANIGAGANFHYGVREIDTPYFSLLSDDDYLLPGFYGRATAGLAAHPEAAFWAGATLVVDDRGTIAYARGDRWERDGVFAPPEGALAMTGGGAPTWTGILFRTRVLEEFGFTDTDTLGPSDLDFLLRLAAHSPFVADRAPVAVFSMNSNSYSAKASLAQIWPGWKKMFQNIENLSALPRSDKDRLLGALRADARRMLFRRALSAVAEGRQDFAVDAAAALSADYSERALSNMIRLLAWGVRTIPGTQGAIRWAHRTIERQVVWRNKDLQSRYGKLLRKD